MLATFSGCGQSAFMSTVFDDVAFAPRNYGMSKAEVNEKTMEALKVVHIEQLKDKQIYKLSGGEKTCLYCNNPVNGTRRYIDG